jgi:microcystin-dependent protein
MTTTYNHGIITFGSATITLPSTTGTLVTINNTLPIGSVIPYAGNSLPTGWLFCDGSAVSRSTYAALFSVIGTNYGIGDGSTTFNLPKMMSGNNSIGIFPAGSATVANTGFNIDNTLKIHNMNSNHKIGTNQIPVHSHSITSHNHTLTHNHTFPDHQHTFPDHQHTFGSHNHSIPTSTLTSFSTFSYFDGNTSTSGNKRRITQGSLNVGYYYFPTTTNTDSSNTSSPSDLFSGYTTQNTDSNTATSGNASLSSGNYPSTQNDYLPSYTAFLWIIKFME